MTTGQLLYRPITDAILSGFYRVYNGLGFGFLEAPYVLALEWELKKLGLNVAREVQVRLHYSGFELMQYRLDMLVEERVVIEVKATERLHPFAERQLYNYLRATNLEVGLLLHFGPEPAFKRVYCPNPTKPHQNGRGNANSAQPGDRSDGSGSSDKSVNSHS